ncbi:MAG: hypothetical protein WBA76_02885, partial [Phormidesmis sp.]
MATESDNSADKKAGRSGLPFEPRRDQKKAGQSAANQAAEKRSATDANALKSNLKPKKQRQGSDQVSARAQAKADEILAENQQKAKKKNAAKGGSASQARRSNGKTDSRAD